MTVTQTYQDVAWLMPQLDVVRVLDRLGLPFCGRNGNRVISYCPDHYLFTGKRPSHPKWLLNEDTGWTFCLTEGRGSNIVWTVSRLRDCEPSEAVRWLADKDVSESELRLAQVRRGISRISSESAEEQRSCAEPEWKREVEASLKNRYVSQRTYDFFRHPPAKDCPTNISPETVDRYRVFERTWGQYANRAIIPFFLREELVGFCAVDLLGKAEWLVAHPTKGEKDYRKTLYPLGFKAGQCLFGHDDCRRGADNLIVVEGAREVMKLWQEGFTDAVAILGASMSDAQMGMVAQLAPKRLVLMFDGDDAGVEITRRIAKKVEPLFKVKECYLPRGKDPKNLRKEEIGRMIFS